jgi:hypothetical protein
VAAHSHPIAVRTPERPPVETRSARARAAVSHVALLLRFPIPYSVFAGGSGSRMSMAAAMLEAERLHLQRW